MTEGDNDVNCGGTTACYGATPPAASSPRGRGSHQGAGPSQSYNGALSTSTTSLAPAFGTAAGWNFANGLGSVNAANLVDNWGK